jgi:hypothetical protein
MTTRVLFGLSITLVATIILLAQAACRSLPIDEVLTKEADLTGDGKPEKIFLHLRAADMRSPFSWTLTINSGDAEIYRYASDDGWLNEFFGDEGYVLGCTGYIECKRKYYFHDLIEGFVLTGGTSYDANGVTDRSHSNTLYPLGMKQLEECCNVDKQTAERILGRVEKRLRDKTAVILDIPISPVKSNPPLIFVPEIERFIRFYEE